MVKHDPRFPHATQLSDGTEVVDDLPADDETLLASGEYDLVAEFDAYVKSSRISIAGELLIGIAVPYEWKYEAMPVTDIRGYTFRMVVLGPRRPENNNGAGTGNNSQRDNEGVLAGDSHTIPAHMEKLPIEQWTHQDEDGG